MGCSILRAKLELPSYWLRHSQGEGRKKKTRGAYLWRVVPGAGRHPLASLSCFRPWRGPFHGHIWCHNTEGWVVFLFYRRNRGTGQWGQRRPSRISSPAPTCLPHTHHCRLSPGRHSGSRWATICPTVWRARLHCLRVVQFRLLCPRVNCLQPAWALTNAKQSGDEQRRQLGFPFWASLNPISVLPTITRASQIAQWLRSHLQCKRRRFDPWVGKIPWRRTWLPTPVFLPGEFHGQRNLAGYSPWGRTESEMTKVT